jgi:septum formation protein
MLTLPPIILASQSPRRQQLLKSLDIDFKVIVKNTPEDYPENLAPEDVPAFLAQKKARVFLPEITNEIVIAADTIVILENEVLGKPQNEQDALQMLKKLSGKKHKVVTGVCLLTQTNEITFSDTTYVYFRNIKEEEINYYVQKYKPYDKAGSYGTQEWFGMIGIERLEGSYFNVMGLPVHQLYDQLKTFCK